MRSTAWQTNPTAQEWQRALARLVDLPAVHGCLLGGPAGILYDASVFAIEEAARRMGLALSPPASHRRRRPGLKASCAAAASCSSTDDGLLGALNQWLCGLPEETFTQLLPLLRRTFATFAAPERRSIGERVRRGPVIARASNYHRHPDFDPPAPMRCYRWWQDY